MHHSVILEFDVPSYRTDAAQQRGQAEEANRVNPGMAAWLGSQAGGFGLGYDVTRVKEHAARRAAQVEPGVNPEGS